MSEEDIFSNLPPSWTIASFDDCIEIVSDHGLRVEQRSYLPTGSIPVVDQGEGLIGGYIDDLAKRYAGPLPVIVFGDHTRRVKFVDFPFAVGAQGVKLLRPLPCWEPKFLAYLMSYLPLPNRGYSRHFQFLRSLRFPLPPLREQRSILRELEKQLSRLDAGISSLKHAQKALKSHRTATLKSACGGRLVQTEEELARRDHRTYQTGRDLLTSILDKRRLLWEIRSSVNQPRLANRTKERTRGKYKEPEEAEIANLPEIPEGWIWASIDQIAAKVVDGVHRKPNYVKDGIPFVTVRNLTAGLGISLEKINYITREDHEIFTRRAKPERGDILVTKDGTLGVTRAVRMDQEFSIFVSVALIKPVIKEISDYFELALSAPQVQAQMLPKGSGLQHIHLEDLRRDCIPLPPLSEQRRIVAEAQRQLSTFDVLSDIIALSLKRAELLRAGILKTSFLGKLAPQDPNDEPASILLERTRQSREASAHSRPRRGRGIKTGGSTPGLATPTDPKPRKGAGNRPQSAYAPSGLRDRSVPPFPGADAPGYMPLPLTGQGGPAAAQDGGPDFLSRSRNEQIDTVWNALLGRGPLEKKEAIRTAAQSLRDEGIASFQRLRQKGQLWEAIAGAVDRGVREGSFDRPRRGYIRAVLPDAWSYNSEIWRRCLLGSLDHEAVEEDEALRAAAEWARESLGLEFERLREDGVILRGLRAALQAAVRAGEIQKARGRIARSGDR